MPRSATELYPTERTCIRVSKRGARKLYNANVPMTIVSCKLWPFSGWQPGYSVRKSDIDSREDGWTFDSLVNNYESYNTSYEQGYYAAFYVNEHDALAHNVTPLRLEH